MTTDDNQTIRKYIGRDAWVIYTKSYILSCKTYTIKGNFFTVPTPEGYIDIHKEHITTIEHNNKQSISRIAYNTHATTKGKLIALNSKFLDIEVINTQNNMRYIVLVPVKKIEGIKFTEEEYNGII